MTKLDKNYEKLLRLKNFSDTDNPKDFWAADILC